MANTAVVLGARNLGGAIIDRFLELGWNTAGVARSDDTLERVRQRGALAIGADAADMASLSEALRTARAGLGVLAALFVKMFVAETKGRSLEEIEADLQRAGGRRRQREAAPEQAALSR